MAYKRIRNPIVPKSRTNPTGSDRLLSRADKEIKARYKRIGARVLDYFDSIPWLAFNADGAYQFPASRMDELRQILAEITYSELVDGQPLTFFFAEYDRDAAQLGLAQSSANLAAISTTYAASRPLVAAMSSAPYQNRVAMAMQRSYTHFTGLSDAMQADLAQTIAQAIANGDNPRVAKAAIMERLGVSESRARLYAQSDITMTLRDAKMGELEDTEESLGIQIKLLWVSALLPTTRRSHGVKHGRIYTPQDVRDFYSKDGNRFNCFLPDTLVSGRFKAATRSFYDGVIVKLVTRSGRSLSVTPNHPLMTDRGLVAAAMLNKGDNLIGYGGEVGRGLFDGVRALDGELTNPTIEQVFSAASDMFKVFQPGKASVDFHGDGRFMNEDIDVVNMERVLMCAVNASIADCLENFKLVSSNLPALTLGGSDTLANAALSSSDSIVCGNGSGGFDVCAFSGRSGELGFALAHDVKPCGLKVDDDSVSRNADTLGHCEDAFSGHVTRMELRDIKTLCKRSGLLSVESVLSHPDGNSCSANAKAIGNLLDSLSGLVFLDDIVDIEFAHYVGHVYDLEEESGLMIANGVIASNCHCSIVETLIEDGVPQLTQKLKATMVAEKQQWEKTAVDA